MHAVGRPEEKTELGSLGNRYGIILKRILNEYGDRVSADYIWAQDSVKGRIR
jgi:hypothetical protein